MLSSVYFFLYNGDQRSLKPLFRRPPQVWKRDRNIPVLAMDILIISKSTKQQALAKKFLLYASNKDVQNEFINKLSRLPANKNSQVINTPLMRDIQNSLNQVDEMSFFYDREVEKQYGQESLEIWKGFMIKPDIEKAQNLMEQARLRYLARQKKVIH